MVSLRAARDHISRPARCSASSHAALTSAYAKNGLHMVVDQRLHTAAPQRIFFVCCTFYMIHNVIVFFLLFS